MALFESGSISLAKKDTLSIQVRRGMTILTHDGQVAGQVAAVVVNSHNQNVTHLLLSQPGQIPEYRLVSVNLIEQIKDEIISLSIQRQAIKTLPLRQTS